MEKYDKFIAALVKKTVLDVQNGIFVYTLVGIMDDGEMDFSTEMFLDHKTGIEYFAMESEEAVLSELDYFYAFPISKYDLKKNYPNIDSKNQRVQEYFNELNRYIYFGIFDSQSGIKILQVWKEALRKMEIEADMKKFEVLYEEGLEEKNILIPSKNIPEIMHLLDKNRMEQLKLYFHFLNENASSEILDLKEFSDRAKILLNPTANQESEKKDMKIVSISTKS